MPQDLPEWFIKKAKAVTAKRAKTVIDHIFEHGHITTEELKILYKWRCREAELRQWRLYHFATRVQKRYSKKREGEPGIARANNPQLAF